LGDHFRGKSKSGEFLKSRPPYISPSREIEGNSRVGGPSASGRGARRPSSQPVAQGASNVDSIVHIEKRRKEGLLLSLGGGGGRKSAHLGRTQENARAPGLETSAFSKVLERGQAEEEQGFESGKKGI